MLSTTTLVIWYVITFVTLTVGFWLDRRVTKRQEAARQQLIDRVVRLLIQEAESITRSAIKRDEMGDDDE